MKLWTKTEPAPIKTQVLDPSETEDLEFVQNFVKKGLDIRKTYEITWYRNMAYFLGYQYLEYEPERGTLRVPPAPPWRVRHVDNHIQPNALHTASKLTENGVIYIPVSESESDDAMYAVRIAKKILKHIQQRNKYRTQDYTLKLLSYIYGMSYRDLLWDFEAGDIVATVPSKHGIDQFIYTGDVQTLVRSPFEVVWEEGATGIDDSNIVATLTVKDLEYIRKAYPKTGEFVQPENISGASSMEKLLMSLMRKHYVAGSSESKTENDNPKHKHKQGKAVIKQLREKPTARFPRGRMLTVANGILLDRSELPFEFMWKERVLGLKQYDFIELKERFPGESPVNIQIPIQDRINLLSSQIAEILNEMAKPKWLVPKQSQVSQTSIDNETGEIIEYFAMPGVAEPHPIQGAAPDQAFYAELDNNKRSLEAAGMMSDTSKGLKVRGVDSKILAEYLAEQDKTVYRPVTLRFEEQDAEFYTWALMLWKEKAIEPRKLQILDENNEVEVFDFNNMDNFPTMLKVIAGSSLPSNLMVKNEKVLNWFNAGLFGDPKNPEAIPESMKMRIMTMTELGDVNEFFRKLKIDLREARREHQLWEKGIVEPPHEYDNHVVMEQEHTIWKKGDIYRRIQKENPELAMAIEEHCVFHIERHPQYVQQQKLAEEEARLKNIEEMKVSGDFMKNQAEIKGKEAERQLALLEAKRGNVSKNQTVKE